MAEPECSSCTRSISPFLDAADRYVGRLAGFPITDQPPFISALDSPHLSVQLQDQTEHTVSSGMLGTKVDYD